MKFTRFQPRLTSIWKGCFCALLLTVAGGYVFQANAQAPVRGNPNAPGLTLANPAVAIAALVQERHTPALFAIGGVVGTGVGLNDGGQVAVKVFTQVPDIQGIPKFLNGVPVDVEVTGMFRALVDTTARFDRPTPIGISTGHPDITAGTIGCRVVGTDGNGNPVYYALSNNHVFANSNEAVIGDPELQPGPYDGGSYPGDAIGVLFDFEPLLFDGSHNQMDAAIALLTEGLNGFPDVGVATPVDGYGTPNTEIRPAEVPLAVQKYGRTTGHTVGKVEVINATVDVCYETAGPFKCKKLARFVGQMLIAPGNFSAGGDSGSLIVTNDGNNNPVGLLFAGSDTYTIANPIKPVLDRFGVFVDDGSVFNQPPVADFSYTANDLIVTFTDQSSDADGSIASWNWDFGDSGTSTDESPTHSYTAAGTYSVTLVVTDGAAQDSITKEVSVGNQPPVADFTYTANDLDVTFADQSSDADGSIVSWSWDFGDNGTSTNQNPTHSYTAAGTYSVTLVATDNEGATSTLSQNVTVNESSGIELTVTATKVKGFKTATLSWSGATTDDVQIFRNGSLVATVNNTGTYEDNLGRGGESTFTYQVCDTLGGSCSNEVIATF